MSPSPAARSPKERQRAVDRDGPWIGVSNPTRQRPSVVLPEPDSPTRPTLSPRRSRSRRRRARRRLACRRDPKVFARSHTRQRGVPRWSGRGVAARLRRRCRAAAPHLAAISAAGRRRSAGPAPPRAAAARRPRSGRAPSGSAARSGTARDLVRRRHRRRDRDQPRHAAVGRRLGQQQAQRVGMQRLGLERVRRPDLEQRPGVEHVDAVADRERDAQVVRDQDQRPCRAPPARSSAAAGSRPAS